MEAKPRPVPFSSDLVEKNGSKRCDLTSSDIPDPLSEIDIEIYSPGIVSKA